GASAIQPFRGESAIDAPLAVEIISPKFPTPRAHLAFFRGLLGDLFECAAHLPFNFEGETSRGTEISYLPPTPLWTRLFLEQNSARLGEALRHFLAQPCRDLASEQIWLDAPHATQFDGAALSATAREPSLWHRQKLRLLPSRVAQNRAFEPQGTPENRFAAAFARRLGRAIEPLDGFPEIEGLCAAISARFPPWSEEIAVSPALERRRVSRELLDLWRLWNGAGAPVFARFERAARLRDIAQLYEFWTFFALADAIGRALGQTPHLETSSDEARGLAPLSRAHFSSGTLVFNGPAPSYSTPLRPDFLWLENGVPALAFDAKFRLENSGEEGELRGRGADLHKMHAYRDALGVRGALAIYPGEVSRFFDSSGGKSAFSLGDLLTGAAQGVGLWALRPDVTKTVS
ncbi:MAG: DUF2357 domain-containing protein, partial [Armatimonadetes bacterium]|nr:DUF2357 domain-containing protein [Armatimonadota bacterium]